MRYSGSKAKIAKYIIPFIMEELKEGYTYVEPFMGGCNMLSEVDWPNKVGADSNRYVVALWNNLKIGSIHSIPKDITEKQYNEMKELAKKGSCSVQYPAWLIGYAGTACSYGSAWFNGYAHIKRVVVGIVCEGLEPPGGKVFPQIDFSEIEAHKHRRGENAAEGEFSRYLGVVELYVLVDKHALNIVKNHNRAQICKNRMHIVHRYGVDDLPQREHNNVSRSLEVYAF